MSGYISTRRVTGSGTVHEMAERGTKSMCGRNLPEPWTYTNDPTNCKRCLRALWQEIAIPLAEIYKPDGMAIWMRSPNKALQGRVPEQMIAVGESSDVLDLIEALATGAVL